MAQTAAEYVQETPDGGWRIMDSRVSLHSVVHAYWEGKSPEAIADEFPTLSAEQVYGAIAFYLRHRLDIDRHLSDQQRHWDEFLRVSQAQHGPLLDRIRAARTPDTDQEDAQ